MTQSLDSLAVAVGNLSAQVTGLRASVAAAGLASTVLPNRQQGGVSSGSGQSSTQTLPAIAPSPGAPGAFEVSGYGTVTTSAPGDEVFATLTRNGSPIGPTAIFRTDPTSGTYALALGPFVDAPGAGEEVYAMLVTNQTAGHTVVFSSASALAQETL